MPKASPETTELERRLLADKKVLQALITFLARTEPRFIELLRERFVEPMRMAPHEHDYCETDDCAEEFIRAAMLIAESRIPQDKAPQVTVEHSTPLKKLESRRLSAQQSAMRPRIQVRERNGIWQVQVDGQFRGHYRQKDDAIAAAALLQVSSQ